MTNEEIKRVATVGVEVENKKTLTRYLRNCFYVYGWVQLSEDDGKYIKLQKTDLMNELVSGDYDLTKFLYNANENNLYVN